MSNATLDALAAQVTETDNVIDSAIALINGIAARVQAAVPPTHGMGFPDRLQRRSAPPRATPRRHSSARHRYQPSSSPPPRGLPHPIPRAAQTQT